ncbi:MAG: response regulator, partial [bacterium]|nr:response regulator [bacterium]
MNKHTILIVEDNRDIVRGITENISEISDNYTFKVAYDGKDVLDILEKEKMDLVILDIQVPGMNGLHLLTSLQKKGIWLPIIILTDSNIDEQDKRLREFGVVELLKKPFLPEKLVIRIAEIMKNRAKRDLIKNLSLPSILQLIEMEK